MRLLCIDDKRGLGSELFENWIEEGEIYTIRRTEGSLTGEQRVLLNEVKNPPIFVTALGMSVEPGFAMKRFIVLEDGNSIQEHKQHVDAVPA